jgi:hypothetical protein
MEHLSAERLRVQLIKRSKKSFEALGGGCTSITKPVKRVTIRL